MTPIVDTAAWLQSLGAIGSFVLLVIKATLILLIARLAIAAIPRASAATRHIALTAALCGVLLLPIVTFVAPSWNLEILPSRPESTQAKGIGITGEEDAEPSALEAAVTVARATGVVAQERITAMSDLLATVKSSWQGMLLLGIGAVSFALLIRMLIGITGVGLVARRATAVEDDGALRELDAARDHLQLGRDVRLLRSSRISMPVVWGLRQPILLLPASSAQWSTERLRVVLLHELAHVKRWDGATLLLTRAAVAVFWFHPMAWSLERIARSECERACDDLVLESGAKPSDYAEHLLAIARALPHTDPFRSVTLAMTRRSELEGRLLSILEPKPRRSAFSRRALSTAAAAALMLLVPLASLKLVAAPKEQPAVGREEVIAEIDSSVVTSVAAAPKMLLAGMEKIRHKRNTAPSDGGEWYGHAYDLYRQDKYAEAIEAFKKSIEHGHRVAASKYNIACSYALLGDENNAVTWLADAIAAGWDDFDHIAEDSDFDPIRSSPRFRQLIAQTGGPREARKHEEKTEDTLDRYDALRAEGGDGHEWFEVGFDLLRLRRLDESINAFEQAAKLENKSSVAMYNIACAYSLKGDVRSAETWLRRAVEGGFDKAEKISNDPDLRALRGATDLSGLVALSNDLKLHTDWKDSWDGFRWLFQHDQAEAWAEKLSHYESVARKYPNIGRAWFNLGYAQLQVGQNDRSAASFQKSITLGYRPGASAYNTACAYARADKADLAFQWLEKARGMGFKLHGYLEGDDDLDNLRDDPRWRELKRAARAERDAGKEH
jgi:beta-lactamase regulating signal transducer with metallopeptidase domain